MLRVMIILALTCAGQTAAAGWAFPCESRAPHLLQSVAAATGLTVPDKSTCQPTRRIRVRLSTMITPIAHNQCLWIKPATALDTLAAMEMN